MKEVYTALFKVQDQWYDIGLQLDMEPSELKVIQKNNPSSKERLREMITQRRNQGNFTWELIAEALENPTVGQNQLAGEIKKNIRPQPAPSSPSTPAKGKLPYKKAHSCILKLESYNCTYSKQHPDTGCVNSRRLLSSKHGKNDNIF